MSNNLASHVLPCAYIVVFCHTFWLHTSRVNCCMKSTDLTSCIFQNIKPLLQPILVSHSHFCIGYKRQQYCLIAMPPYGLDSFPVNVLTSLSIHDRR